MRLRAKLILGLATICVIAVVIACNISNSHAITLDDVTRTYEIYTPPSLNKRSGKNKPLLLVLHGNPSNGWQMRMYSGMNKVAKKDDFIVAYPSALTGKWPFTDPAAIQNEVEYIDAVIDDIVARYPVDTSRIYASGISGGGIFSFLLANEIPARLAAIAVVAGNLPKFIEHPEEIQPMPLVLFHGTEDFLYHGRADLYSADSTITLFGMINECQSKPITEQLADSRNDNTTVEQIDFDCHDMVRFYRIENGGHHWPGASFNASRFTKMELGIFCRDINASQLIWDFVSQQHK